jgi:phosphatidylglycerol:prolipoprotein diacylglycerol transferase
MSLAALLPALVAYPAIDPVAISIGPIAIRWYALAYVTSLLIGWRLMMRLARRSGGPVTPLMVDDFLVWAILGVILGGRLGYILLYNLDQYMKEPLAILEVWHGGMSFHGGMLGVTLAIVLFARSRGVPVLALADLIAPVVPIGLFFGRLANFINGELFGRPADVPWAMVFPTDELQVPRHPSQLYQAGLEGIVLLAILWIVVASGGLRRRGMTTGVFLLGYGVARIVGEFFREPDRQLGFLWGGATMGQLLSVPMVLAGLGLVAWSLSRPAVEPAPVR